MALQATFVADFTQFEQSVRNATDTLKQNFEVSSKTVSTSLQKLAESFSGSKIIADAQKAAAAVEAIGGAARLTEKEQARVNATVTEAIAKYRALGQTAPAELQKLATETAKVEQKTSLVGKAFSAIGPQLAATFSIGAITAFVAKTVDWADSMQDLADRTGFSTTTIQRLSAVANTTGTSVEALAKASGFLSRTLGDRSAGTVKAVEELGLSYAALSQMSPEEQFTAVSKALMGVEDANRRASLGADLLGKTFTEIQPALKRVAAGLDDIAVADEAAIKAAADLKDAWEEAKRGLLVAMAEMIGGLKRLEESWVGTVASFISGRTALREGSRGNWLSDWLGLELDDVKAPAAAMANWRNELKNTGDASLRTAEQTAAMEAALARTVPTLKSTEAATKAATAATKAAATEAAAHAAALEAERKALDKLTGADGLDLAMKLIKQINDSGGVKIVDPEQLPSIEKTMERAIGYLDRMGVGADETREKITAMWVALQSGVPGLSTAPPVFPGFQFGEIPATGMPGMVGGADIMSWLAGVPGTGALGGRPQSPLGALSRDFAANLAPTIGSAFQGGGNVTQSLMALAVSRFGANQPQWLQGVNAGLMTFGAGVGYNSPKRGAWAGAAQGAAIGTAIMPGVGTAVGAGIGALVGYFKGKAKERQVVKDLLASFVQASGGLEELQKQAKLADFNLTALLKAKTEKGALAQIAALQKALSEVQARVASIVTDLTEVETTGGLLSPDLMKRLLRDFNNPDVQEALGAFLKGQTDRATSGLEGALSAPTLGEGALGGLLDAGGALFGSMLAQGRPVVEIFETLNPLVAQLNERLLGGEWQTYLKGSAEASQALFEAQATGNAEMIRDAEMRVALWDTERARILANRDAVLALHPEFAELMRLSDISSNQVNADAIKAAAGLNDVISGLFNTGMMTEGMFVGLSDAVYDSFSAMREQGVSSEDAMRLMQPTLQTLWTLMTDFGFSVSDSTREMLKLAEESGIVGDKFRDPADKMMKAIDGLIAKIGELIDSITTGLGDAARRGGDEFIRIIGGVRPTIDVGVRYVDQGGIDAVTNVRAMAEGGIVTHPTVALLGEAGPEAVVPLSRTRGIQPVVVHVDARGAYVGDYSSQRSFATAVELAVGNVLRGNVRFAAG